VVLLGNRPLQRGDLLQLKVISPIYRDMYQTEVLAVEGQAMTVSMPMAQGKMVLLSAGTPMQITCPRSNITFSSEIISRGFKPEPHLVIQLPFHLAEARGNRPRVITVTSGKGGVGKTSTTINLAITLAQMGQRVFIIDADLGTANVDVLLNLQPKYNLTHIINKEKELLDIIVEGPGGVYLVPGGSGLQNLANIEEWQFNRLIASLQTLEQYADIILIDTGAGLGKNVINFALAADDIIIITTPEPHSITDAYAIIKVLDEQQHKKSPLLVLNRVESLKEYQEVSGRMVNVVNRFLTLKMSNLGYILEDPTVPRANRRLEPFALHYPNCPAAQCIKNIAQQLLNPGNEHIPALPTNQSFFSKIKELFSR
jgi:flagellar biosynthesis protein FlhG